MQVAIDKEQAEVVRFIFTEYANDTDKKEIADELNKRHILYKDKPFTFRTFENWLSNAKYTGEFMHGQRLCANTYPAIIDKATFAKVQKRLQQNKILAGANSAIEPYLLTGNVVYANGHTKSKLELKQSNQCKVKAEKTWILGFCIYQ